MPDSAAAFFKKAASLYRVSGKDDTGILHHLAALYGRAWVEKDHAKPGNAIEIRLANGRSVWGEVLDGHAAYDPEGEKLRA